jgi:hypothetical protein
MPIRSLATVSFSTTGLSSRRVTSSQQRLLLPNLADHRLGGLPLEEELDDLLGLGADDAVEEHAASIARRTRAGRFWL